MPRSKRDKKISLTQTKKKGIDNKASLISKVQDELDSYNNIFTFSIANMRNGLLKDIRQEWKDSRFFFGKLKVIAVALGKSKESEYKSNLSKLTKRLNGQMGLLMTNRKEKDVLKFFKNYSESDYARCGNTADQTVKINEGPVDAFPFNMEPELRQLNLPTKLVKGIIHVREDYVICKAGEVLTSQQSRLLKHFCHKMAKFSIIIDALWCKDGSFKIYNNISPKQFKKIKLQSTKCNEDDEVHFH